MTIHTIKIILIIIIASFFTHTTFNNITDYETNHTFVKKVLTMDGVQSQKVLWRKVESPRLITAAYISIIVIEAVVALLCWLSGILMLFKRNGKFLGLLGLTLAFALFMFGFIVVAGEYFYMWQNPGLAGLQLKAAVFALIMLSCMIFLTTTTGSSRNDFH